MFFKPKPLKLKNVLLCLSRNPNTDRYMEYAEKATYKLFINLLRDVEGKMSQKFKKVSGIKILCKFKKERLRVEMLT